MANTGSFVQVPIDAGGKKMRTQLQTVGVDDVHSEFVVAMPFDRQIVNIYRFCSLALTIGAAADGANAGRIYIENDPDSTVLISVTKITFRSQLGTTTVVTTSPVIAARKFTFTGNTPSGAAIVGSILDSQMVSKDSNWNVRTASTGMVITEGADVANFLPIAAATAVGFVAPSESTWQPEADRPMYLRAGEGIMIKQVDAGTASDGRRFVVEIEVEQFVDLT